MVGTVSPAEGCVHGRLGAANSTLSPGNRGLGVVKHLGQRTVAGGLVSAPATIEATALVAARVIAGVVAERTVTAPISKRVDLWIGRSCSRR